MNGNNMVNNGLNKTHNAEEVVAVTNTNETVKRFVYKVKNSE